MKEKLMSLRTFPGMTSHTSIRFPTPAGKLAGLVERFSRQRRRAVQGSAAQWPAAAGNGRQAPREGLFWSFFMYTAVAALPLVGMRWTTPEAALRSGALQDALLLALPVAVPLPFLFLGCLTTLALHPASRTPAALGTFGVAMLVGLAALHALVA
jgi:hypothetical protein